MTKGSFIYNQDSTGVVGLVGSTSASTIFHNELKKEVSHDTLEKTYCCAKGGLQALSR